MLATYGTLPTEAPGPSDRQPKAPTLPAPELCMDRGSALQGVTLPIAERLDVRLNPAQAAPGQAEAAAISGWIRFRDGTDPDPQALALFCDAFPPSVFGLLGAVGWVPTVSLNVELRRCPGSWGGLPAPSPARTSKVIACLRPVASGIVAGRSSPPYGNLA